MIVSIHHPQNDFKVYQEDYRWSDKWNVLEYGRDFDFTRPFFDQFQELLKDVPKIALTNEKNENSPYANYSSNNKNIHLCADVMDSEDVYFSNTIKTVKNSLDLTDIENSENCYECICSINLYNCLYTYYSQDCKNSI